MSNRATRPEIAYHNADFFFQQGRRRVALFIRSVYRHREVVQALLNAYNGPAEGLINDVDRLEPDDTSIASELLRTTADILRHRDDMRLGYDSQTQRIIDEQSVGREGDDTRVLRLACFAGEIASYAAYCEANELPVPYMENPGAIPQTA